MSDPERAALLILIAEDHRITRNIVAAVLLRAGYRIVVAANGHTALARLADNPPPDLMMLDMLMPKLDGWHVLIEMKSLPHFPPVIVVTGTILTREWAEQNGCAGFLKKPIDQDELLAEVQRILA